MKTEIKILVVVLSLLFFSCSSEMLPACYREVGQETTRHEMVPFFDKINIGEGVTLEVSEGATASVSLVSGENIIDEMEVMVSVDSTLYIKNNLGCTLGTLTPVKALVTVPNLKKIYSSSQYNVSSNGVLNFPNLTLQQGLYGKTASTVFDFEVNCQNLVVENNNTTVFKIKGQTQNLQLAIYGGDARFEGGALIAKDIFIFQRSTNDMFLNPINSISGNIYSSGNVILRNRPTTVNVVQHYTGHLVYP